MSSRIEEWMGTENTAVKSYDQLLAEQGGRTTTEQYNEKIIKPWMEQNRMENEIRKKLGAPPDWATDKEKIEFHRRQLALLGKANRAPRCEHIFSDGRQCRSPRMRKEKHCYAHVQMLERKPQRMNLPPLEDANAVALWLMEVSRGLLDGQISERTAGLLFYGLQLAMVNARWTTFQETNPGEMVRKLPKNLTAKDATGAKKRMEPQRARRSTEAGESCEEFHPQRALRDGGWQRDAESVNGAQPRTTVPHGHAISGDRTAKSLFIGDEPGKGGTSQ